MNSLIELHAHCRAVYLGFEQVTLTEFMNVLKYWDRVIGKNAE